MQREIDGGEKVEGIDFDKNYLTMIQLIDFCQNLSCSTLNNHQKSRLNKFNYINNIFFSEENNILIYVCVYIHIHKCMEEL